MFNFKKLLFWRRSSQVVEAPQEPVISLVDLTSKYSKVRESSEDARRESEIQQTRQQLSDLVAKHSEDTGELDFRLTNLRDRRTRALAPLLPVEQATRTRIEEEYKRAVKEVEDARVRFNQTFNATKTELDTRLSRLENEVPTQFMDGMYPRLDAKFLSMKRRDKQYDCDVPRFAMFDLSQPKFVVTAHANYYGEQEYITSTPNCYKDFFDGASMLAATRKHMRNYNHQLAVTATFNGVLPVAVRDMIRDIREKFDHIYLIGEADFALGKEVGVTSAPLVVGEKDGAFWVITVFDATPSTDYVEREFIRGGDGPAPQNHD